MGRRVALLVVAAAALAVVLGTAAQGARSGGLQELSIPASDGVQLACALDEPDGSPPSGGWPAVLLFHGLGGSHKDMEALATGTLAPAGYASLMCDARGTGSSGGLWDLDGP
ncbi:MAG: CocE/NonD family hydrolase, partial [Gaiellaceae bacterium]